MNVAVIPARGGSKRIPRKNVKPFAGKPMIAHSIDSALASGVFDKVIVSTDDLEIAEIAKTYGADVPFIRPQALSDDHAGTTEVVAHAVEYLLSEGHNLSAVCCIYATAPFVRPEDLREGLAMLTGGDWNYVFGATTFAYPIFRSLQRTEDGGVKMFFPEHFNTRSQDLPEALHDAGQFYWGLPQAWVDRVRMFDSTSAILSIPRWRVQDIDTEEDWARAEAMSRYLFATK